MNQINKRFYRVSFILKALFSLLLCTCLNIFAKHSRFILSLQMLERFPWSCFRKWVFKALFHSFEILLKDEVDEEWEVRDPNLCLGLSLYLSIFLYWQNIVLVRELTLNMIWKMQIKSVVFELYNERNAMINHRFA